MKLMLYNSLSHAMEVFIPSSHPVTMYSCGPTVYSPPHIGNFRSFLFSDLVHRALRVLGYQVKLVMNLTDVDDKTIAKANESQTSLEKWTEPHIKSFHEDLKKLRMLPASHYPRATEFISEMIDMIQGLLEKGHAYQTAEGSVYFKIDTFKNYGKLSKINLDAPQRNSQKRTHLDEYDLNNVSDFALWKHHRPEDGNVFWTSPFGKGRPGWHIECSTMSQHYLGIPIDIHTGGIDNKFPHHENEIAQSECYHSRPYVKYWLHCLHLLVEGQKMSKSKGNDYTLRSLEEDGLSPVTLRYMLLSSHYRHHYNFTQEGIHSARKAIERVNQVIQKLHQKIPSESTYESRDTMILQDIKQYKQNFLNELCHDLNTAGCLREVHNFVTYLNTHIERITSYTAKEGLHFFTMANNIFASFELDAHPSQIPLGDLPEHVQGLVKQRQHAKQHKDWQQADHLRKHIEAAGYRLTDLKHGFEITRLPS